MKFKGFMNLYHNGFYHRRGKPGDCNVHGGDVYLDELTAQAYIEPEAGFIATVPIEFEAPEDLKANPIHSVPLPLHQTRKMLREGMAEWRDGWPFVAPYQDASLYGNELPTEPMIRAMDDTVNFRVPA